jgi:hypothetical protein
MPYGFRALVGDAEPQLGRALAQPVTHLLNCDRDAGKRIVQVGTFVWLDWSKMVTGCFILVIAKPTIATTRVVGYRWRPICDPYVLSEARLCRPRWYPTRHQEAFPQPITGLARASTPRTRCQLTTAARPLQERPANRCFIQVH